MLLASNSVRDTVAEAIAGVFGWLGDVAGWVFGNLSVAAWVAGGLAVLALLWRLSVAFGPKKVCWWCKGSGHVGGLLGGRRVCSHCDGGLRDRVGGGR